MAIWNSLSLSLSLSPSLSLSHYNNNYYYCSKYAILECSFVSQEMI